MTIFSPSRLPIQTPSPSATQLYSIDCYQRIQKKALANLRWEHLCTAAESSNNYNAIKGYTEWQTVLDGALLSLSWDWLHGFDRNVIPDFRVGLRTNILCIDDRGYDLPIESSEALLEAAIERLDWHHFVTGLH